MRRQKGFSLIEFFIVIAILGIIAVIAVPTMLRLRGLDNLKTFYDITAVPETPQEKALIRPYMQDRLTEYEKAAEAACAVKTAEAQPVGTGAEATKRMLEYRKNCTDATWNLRVARRVYFDDYAIAPKQ